jgi:hypothetical protein
VERTNLARALGALDNANEVLGHGHLSREHMPQLGVHGLSTAPRSKLTSCSSLPRHDTAIGCSGGGLARLRMPGLDARLLLAAQLDPCEFFLELDDAFLQRQDLLLLALTTEIDFHSTTRWGVLPVGRVHGDAWRVPPALLLDARRVSIGAVARCARRVRGRSRVVVPVREQRQRLAQHVVDPRQLHLSSSVVWASETASDLVVTHGTVSDMSDISRDIEFHGDYAFGPRTHA